MVGGWQVEHFGQFICPGAVQLLLKLTQGQERAIRPIEADKGRQIAGADPAVDARWRKRKTVLDGGHSLIFDGQGRNLR